MGLTAVVRLGSGRTGFTMAAGIASLEASTPRLVATASMAWILAVTAAAATAEALNQRNDTVRDRKCHHEINLGIAWGIPPAPRFRSPGGVTALPTLRSCPPRSNKFMLLIASYKCGILDNRMF